MPTDIEIIFEIVVSSAPGTYIPISSFSCQNGLPAYLNADASGGSLTNIIFDPVTFKLSFTHPGTPGNFTLHVDIDCSIIPVVQGSTIFLRQTWTSNSGPVDLNTSGSAIKIDPVSYPFLIIPQAQADEFNVNYNGEYDIEFIYQNTSSSSSVTFDFLMENTNVCGSYDFSPNVDVYEIDVDPDPLTLPITSGSFVADGQNWNTNFTLLPLQYLILRRKIKITGCVATCTGEQAILKWRCHNPFFPNPGCEDCLKEYITSFRLETIGTALEVKRLDEAAYPNVATPTSTLVREWDYGCFSSTEKTTWVYRITNLGTETLDHIKIKLDYDGSAGDQTNSLTLIYENDINVNYFLCPGCTLNTATSTPKTNYNCTGGSALKSWEQQIDNFGPDDYVDLVFQTLRCPEQGDELLNVGKFLNNWDLEITNTNVCGGNADLLDGNDNLLVIDGDRFKTCTSHDTHAHLNLSSPFTPLVSNVVVPVAIPPFFPTNGAPIPLHVDIQEMLKQGPYNTDGQIFGCSTYTDVPCSYNGYLRVSVHTESGLLMEPTSNPNTWPVITKTNSPNWVPFYFNTAPLLTCNSTTYYFYFDMDDVIDASEYFKMSKFEFALVPCCAPALPNSPYSIRFDVMPDPNNCYQNAFTTPSDNITPLFTSSTCPDCGWIPLSIVSNIIAVQCPGCNKPGMEIKNYAMERKSMGLMDTDNDRIADDPPTTITWQPGSGYNTFYSNHGDVLLDRTYAKIGAGAAAPGGYSFIDLNTPDILLDVLQLNRIIPHGGPDEMNLKPTSFKFYIDKPLINASCIDCDLFTDWYPNYASTYETERVIEVNKAANPTEWNKFVQVIPSPNGNDLQVFFTFSNDLHTPSDINMNSSVIYPPSPVNFTGFDLDHRYRLVVEYEICGNYVTPDPTSFELSRLQTNIENKMWLTGKRQDSDAESTVQTASDVKNDLPVPFGTTISPPTLNDYVDDHLFWCEGAGGPHYFLSAEALNKSTYTAASINKCDKVVSINFISRLGGGTTIDLFPGEYKIPPFIPTKFSINDPVIYQLDNFRANSTYDFINSMGSLQTITTPATTLSVTPPIPPAFWEVNVGPPVPPNNISFPSCLIFNQPLVDWVVGDQYATYSMQADLVLDPCSLGVLLQANSNDLLVEYNTADPNYCANNLVGTSANCSTPVTVPNSNLTPGHLNTPNTNLVFTFLPPAETAQSNIVSWEFQVTNDYILNPPQTITDAHYVFLKIPESIDVPYLTDWKLFDITNGTPGILKTIDNGIAQVAIKIVAGSAPRFYQLEAKYIDCQEPSANFDVDWGWYCDGYPNYGINPPICQESFSTLILTNGTVLLEEDGKNFPLTNTTCSSFFIDADISSTSDAFYPEFINLINMPPDLHIISVEINECYNTVNPPAQLSPVLNDPHSYAISPNDLIQIGFLEGSMSEGQCLHIVIEVQGGCTYTGLVPVIQLAGLNFCNDPVSQDANPNGTIGTNQGCTDCFTITKTPSTLVTVPFETVSFELEICNTELGIATVNLIDFLPDNFVVTSPNPCLWCEYPGGVAAVPEIVNFGVDPCVTYTIEGFYTDESQCNANSNTAQIGFASAAGMPQTIITDQACIEVSCDAVSDYNWLDGEDVAQVFTTIQPPQTPPYSLTSNVISINGTFTINADLTLNGCTVYMYPGAQIVVNPGINFTLDNTTITGCFTMWNRIHALSESIITVMNGSTIRDADVGIFAENTSSLRISNSAITDCVRGIFVPPAINPMGFNSLLNTSISSTVFGMTSLNGFKTDYPNQSAHGDIPFAGIELHDIAVLTIGRSGVGPNQFVNMHSGVVTHRSQRITVLNSHFNDILPDVAYTSIFKGAAVASFGDISIHKFGDLMVSPVPGFTTMQNCFNGIYTSYSNLIANGLTMTGMGTGVFSTLCTGLLSTDVSGNTIEASWRGIDWIDNEGARFMNAGYNNIMISDNVGGIGILLQEPNSAGGTANYLIGNYNLVEIISATGGIIAQVVERAIVRNNDVIVHSNQTDYPDAMGIGLLAGGNHTVSCNTVTGTDPSYWNSFGLAGVDSPNLISCNSFPGTGRGMFFAGLLCNPTHLVDNVMSDNYVGLHLSPNAHIGQQPVGGNAPFNGNRWTGNFGSTYGAVNFNWGSQFILSQNLFTVNPTTDPAYEPVIPLDDNDPPFYVENGGWFVEQISGSTISCSQIFPPPCGDSQSAMSGGDEELFMLIVSDSTLSAEYIPETKATGRQLLYQALENDSVLLASETAYQNFKNLHQNSAVGQLHTSRQFMSGYDVLDSASQLAVLFNDSMMTFYNDGIYVLDSMHALSPVTNYSFLRQNLINSLTYYHQARSGIISQLQPANLALLNNAQGWNQFATPNEVPHENEKAVNSATFDYFRYGRDTLIEHETILHAIATQCPYAGGRAVYQARVMLSLLGDTTLYHDLTVCQQQGMYRQEAQSNTSLEKEKGIRIVPNPAAEKARVIIPKGNTGICFLSLYDCFGRIAGYEKLDCSIQEHILDLKLLLPGIYTVKVQLNETHVQQVKLIIAK